MSEILRKRKIEWIPQYEHAFEREDGSGYAFPCDQGGEYKDPRHIGCAATCKADPTLVDLGIVTWERKHITYTLIKCDCGSELELYDPITNECKCGQFYNGGGQRLCHPRFWGEETNESFDDHGNYLGEGWAPPPDEE